MRVLLAVDRLHVASHLAARLQGLGHEVAGTVTDGRAAVEAARALRPDAVILSLRLPVLGGIDAAAAIRAGRMMPLILCTHYVTADVARLARRAGIMAWVSPWAERREVAAVMFLAGSLAGEFPAP